MQHLILLRIHVCRTVGTLTDGAVITTSKQVHLEQLLMRLVQVAHQQFNTMSHVLQHGLRIPSTLPGVRTVEPPKVVVHMHQVLARIHVHTMALSLCQRCQKRTVIPLLGGVSQAHHQINHGYNDEQKNSQSNLAVFFFPAIIRHWEKQDIVPAEKGRYLNYNMFVLIDGLNIILTTGEKNGCIYTLCFKTFVFNRSIELGLGRFFQL